jgi:hypothetical protein
MRVYALTVRNRFLATLAILALIGLGAAVVAVGFTLLLGLAAAGTLVGAGMSIYNRIRGRSVESLPRPVAGLDPRLQVFPERRVLQGGDAPSSGSQN